MARRFKADGVSSNVSDILSDMVAGTYDMADHVIPKSTPPTFIRMIVLDVISDPNSELASEERKSELQGYGVTNVDLIEELPRNTIVAKKVGEDSAAMFVYPFFPSHISMPCKPGECVWVMVEKPGVETLEIAYWFSKTVESRIADDVNHSHPGRSSEISMSPGTKEVAEREKNGSAATGEAIWHELRNGPVMKIGSDRMTSSEAVVLSGESEDIFERLITETKASRLTQYESVPRFRKRPGDVVLEGSNNTLIVLGLERSGSIELPGDQPTHGAGSIDIVVGRGQTEKTSGKAAATTSIKDAKGEKKGTSIKSELNKSPDMLEKNEGDPDLKNDRSRLMLSQRSKIDKNFGIEAYNQLRQLQVYPSDLGEPGIVMKSDRVRLIARVDFQVIVTGFDEKQKKTLVNGKETSETMRDEKDFSKDGRVNWASITIQSNGDIIFTPSDDGYIRLGGPDANLGIVCSDEPVGMESGGVSGNSLITTMGGAFAGSKAAPDGKSNSPVLATGQAKFANKVLIK